jgi:hypothetical protein
MDETLWGHKLQNSFLSLHPRDRIYQKKLQSENNLDSVSNKNKNAVIRNYTTPTESLSNFIRGK